MKKSLFFISLLITSILNGMECGRELELKKELQKEQNLFDQLPDEIVFKVAKSLINESYGKDKLKNCNSFFRTCKRFTGMKERIVNNHRMLKLLKFDKESIENAAVRLDWAPSLEKLLKTSINFSSEDKNKLLRYAVKHNSENTAALLLAKGSLMDERDEFGDTLLHLAAKCDSKEVAELLLRFGNGALVNQPNNIGWIPLHLAAMRGSKNTAELLLSWGSSVNRQDTFGETPLNGAVQNNSKEVTELLLKHGALVNMANNTGLTPLHCAAERDSKEIAELLLAYGGNIAIHDWYRKFPKDYAKNDEMKKLLKDNTKKSWAKKFLNFLKK